MIALASRPVLHLEHTALVRAQDSVAVMVRVKIHTRNKVVTVTKIRVGIVRDVSRLVIHTVHTNRSEIKLRENTLRGEDRS